MVYLSCVEFAVSEPVKGLQDEILLSYFTKLRETLDLFMSWDWPTYFHDYGHQTNKYKQVDPETAIVLLEKYLDIILCRSLDADQYFCARKCPSPHNNYYLYIKSHDLT